MSAQPEQRTIEVPERGTPSDWRRFRGRKPTVGPVALCDYTLEGRFGHLSQANGGRGHATWRPLCEAITHLIRDTEGNPPL